MTKIVKGSTTVKTVIITVGTAKDKGQLYDKIIQNSMNSITESFATELLGMDLHGYQAIAKGAGGLGLPSPPFFSTKQFRKWATLRQKLLIFPRFVAKKSRFFGLASPYDPDHMFQDQLNRGTLESVFYDHFRCSCMKMFKFSFTEIEPLIKPLFLLEIELLTFHYFSWRLSLSHSVISLVD